MEGENKQYIYNFEEMIYYVMLLNTAKTLQVFSNNSFP